MIKSKRMLKLRKRSYDNKNKKYEDRSDTSKTKTKINYSKLKFNKNLLIQILKKTRFKHLLEKKNKSKNNSNSKINDFNSDEPLKSSDKVQNIYENLWNIPEMKKYHNITAEKISDLINSKDEVDESYNHPRNLKLNNFKEKLKTEENEGSLLRDKINFLKTSDKKKKFQSLLNNEFNKEKNPYPIYSNNIKHINIKDINLNKANILPYLSTRLNYQTPKKKYNSLHTTKKNQTFDIIPKTSKKFMSKTSTINATNKWLESIRDSIKRYDILHRSSKIDRLIFSLENPNGCFEENLFEERPGDKYIMLKNQMVRYKDKFENIIREIKLSQKKSEYLMKKYIFDLSRKKNIY